MSQFDAAHKKIVAAGRVNADGTVDAVFGCSVAHVAASGIYTLTIFSTTIPNVPQGNPVPANRLLANVTVIGATPRIVSIEDSGDNAKIVNIVTNAGAAIDNEFCFELSYFLPAG